MRQRSVTIDIGVMNDEQRPARRDGREESAHPRPLPGVRTEGGIMHAHEVEGTGGS